MARPRKYPQELLDRGVRLALEGDRPIAHIAADLGINSEVLRKRVRQAEADQGLRKDLLTSEEREEIRRLRKENAELRRANEILRSASLFFARELDPDREGFQNAGSCCGAVVFVDQSAESVAALDFSAARRLVRVCRVGRELGESAVWALPVVVGGVDAEH